jgi:hypothetical protein
MPFIKRKILAWLGVDKIETGFYNKAFVLENEIRKINSKLCLGVDVHFEGKNWAVLCVDGKPAMIRFIPLGKQDAIELRHFLERFKNNNVVLDLPMGFPEGYFKDFMGKH